MTRNPVMLLTLGLGFLLALPQADAQRRRGKAADEGTSYEFKPEEVKQSGPASKVLERALKLYDTEDYYNSTIELHKVIEGESGDSEANQQKAEFFMGKGLYQMGFHAASLSFFDKIVQKGAAHRYFAVTLKWLASLSRHLPESSGILEKIGKYSRADLEQPALEPVRNELYYLLGRHHYVKSNFKEAVALFQSVPQASEFYAPAKFFEGVTYVRQYQGRPAVEAFKSILRAALEKTTPRNKEYEDLANLSLARVFYSTRQFDTAVKYFDRVPQDSPDWLASLFESAWAYFMLEDYSRALGNIHTLTAPYFEGQFFPESYILRAVTYFRNCHYDRSAEAIAEFQERYPGLKRELDKLLAAHPDNAEFYGYVRTILDGSAGLPERVDRFARSALADRTLRKNFSFVDELDRELKLYESAEPAWRSTAVAGSILQDLTLQKSLAVNEAGTLARARLSRLSGEIQEFIKQAIKIEYEILNAQKNQLEQAILNEQVAPQNVRARGRIVVDDEHETWNFRGEYWKDELGSYRYRVTSQCTR